MFASPAKPAARIVRGVASREPGRNRLNDTGDSGAACEPRAACPSLRRAFRLPRARTRNMSARSGSSHPATAGTGIDRCESALRALCAWHIRAKRQHSKESACFDDDSRELASRDWSLDANDQVQSTDAGFAFAQRGAKHPAHTIAVDSARQHLGADHVADPSTNERCRR